MTRGGWLLVLALAMAAVPALAADKHVLVLDNGQKVDLDAPPDAAKLKLLCCTSPISSTHTTQYKDDASCRVCHSKSHVVVGDARPPLAQCLFCHSLCTTSTPTPTPTFTSLPRPLTLGPTILNATGNCEAKVNGTVVMRITATNSGDCGQKTNFGNLNCGAYASYFKTGSNSLQQFFGTSLLNSQTCSK